MNDKSEQQEAERQGDELLRRLLHTPPQPRPHRERTKAKPGGKPKPAAKLRKARS